MWNDFVEVFQAGLLTSCLFLLAVALVACAVVAVGPFIRDQWRKFRGRDIAAKAVAIIAAIVAVAYGGSKSHNVQNAGADDGISLAGITAAYDSTNELTAVEVKFTGGGVTVATPVSVRNAETEQWRELVKIDATITSDLPTNILAFATAGNASTNRFWWVGTNTPPVVVTSEGITITNFVASSHSVHIAWTCDDPKATEFAVQRRRTNPTARSYVQDGLIAMWDGIENAGWGVHDPNATMWKDLVGDKDITIVGGVFGDTALACNGTQYGGYYGSVVNGVQIELVANAKQQKRRCWIASTGQSLSNRYSGFVGWYDRGLCFGLYDTQRSLTLGTAISYSFVVNSSNAYENNTLVATESGKADLTPQAQRGICVVVGGTMNNPLMCDIHCFRIYSRALTEAEIAHNYEIDKPRFLGIHDWETVATTECGSFDYIGFTVGESWEWRITSTYTEGE